MLGTAPTIRSAALSCRLQPSLITPTTYHTTSSPLSRPESTSSTSTSSRRVPLPKRNILFKTSSSSSTSYPLRHASTISSSTPSQTTTPLPSSPTPTHLDWNTFFKLRKTRRWYQLGSSIGTGAGSFVLSTQVLINSDMDAIVNQIPLDPFISMGLITFAAAGAGWLVGPIVGTGFFNWQNRKFRAQMDEREKEFFKRVKRFRVDPSASSLANPVPDYYGEKISSVGDYRRWLKDQRAFNKKRQTYV